MSERPRGGAAALELSIERLVLTGFSRLDAQRVRDGFAQRLQELALRPELTEARARSEERLALTIDAGRTARRIGRDAADALWKAVLE